MAIVNVHEAKTTLSELLRRVEDGEPVTIARGGIPVADLVRHDPGRTLHLGILKGRCAPPPEDFDEPDPDVLAMFYGDVDRSPR